MKLSADPAVSTAERFRAFAEVEARGLSDCYQEWALGVSTDRSILALLERLPPKSRQPNLVFSAARYLGAPVGSYSHFARWLADHWDDVDPVCRSHSTQTNEPGRCATLLPALAAVPGPIALIEVGASAGLCLYPDRYSYRFISAEDSGRHMLHPSSGPSPVLLDCEYSGPVPLPETLPEVVWRAGIDLNPLDVHDEANVAWLDALVWPEHDDRRARLHAAVELARAEPVELVRGDLVEEVEALVARAPAGASLVVFHTAVLAYLDTAARLAFADIMGRLPVTWLANEGRGVVPGVPREPGGVQPSASADFVLARNGEPIAFTQPHGRSLRWLG